MAGKIFIDSGAFSLYQLKSKKGSNTKVVGATFSNRQYDDYSYYATKEYKEYRRAYRKFLQKNAHLISVACNLDVINNPELTRDNQEYFEKHKVDVIPVFHLGNDLKYLEHYLNMDYEYFALGGMTPNPYKVLKPILDDLWWTRLTDIKGMPIIKVHGLAITSPNLLFRYPWYSVDSSSWVRYGMYGGIVVPRKVKGKYDYTKSPHVITVTPRSPANDVLGKHINTLSGIERIFIIEYIERMGFKLGVFEIKNVESGYKLKRRESWFNKAKTKVEVVIIKGISNDNIQRDLINAVYFKNLGASIPKYPWAFTKGQKSGSLFSR